MSVAKSLDTIAITGRGMVSSLGHDVVTACAAARAGLVRSEQLDYEIQSPEDGKIESAIGHSIPLWTEGFEGPTRLLRLAQAGLSDLQRQVVNKPWTLAPTACYLSLPNSFRAYTGIPLSIDEKDRQARIEESEEIEMEPPDIDMAESLLQSAARLSNWQGDFPLTFVTTSGNTGVAEALRRAIDDLVARRIELAIVGGIDSLLEEDLLVWLENTGRLKIPSNPAGLQPGESAAFVLLELMRSAKTRGSNVFGIVEDIHLSEDSRTLLSGEPPLGVGLTEALNGTLKNGRCEDLQPFWLITDQNGEVYRAMEWGNVVVRILAHSRALAEPVLWYPATSFGDTGAASGAVSLCMATSAFTRNYAPAEKVAITSSSEGSLRAVTFLARPNK